MNKARLLGAILGITVMSGYVLWRRMRPAPCTGGVTLELRPPLEAPGTYRFHVELDGIPQPCEFAVPFPVQGRVDTSTCGHAVELRTRVEGAVSKIVGLTIGAAPESLLFRLTRNGERLYDAVLRTARERHPQVAGGMFGAHMEFELVNDGPVTIPLRIE